MRRLPVALAVVLLACLAPAAAGGRANAVAALPACPSSHWIAAWTASPGDAVTLGDPNLNPGLNLARQSYRMVLVPHRSGSVIRIHLTNRFGSAPIVFHDVTVGLKGTGASIVGGSLRRVTFRGLSSVSIPAGADVVSDPIRLAVVAWRPVAVSFYVPGVAWPPTEHFNADQTSYYSMPLTGDHASDLGGAAYTQKITSWYWIDGLDVVAPGNVSTVVNFGDSITDGFTTNMVTMVPASTTNIDQNQRYPDYLQRRISAAGLRFVTVDAGISGNRVLQPGLIPQFGPSALVRAGRDAASVPGGSTVIWLEGINDLGQPPFPTVQQMIAGDTRIIGLLRSRGIRVILGTIMPSGSAILDGPVTAPNLESSRQAINAWIRTQHLTDGVVDFDRAMRDPAHPGNLNPIYADGDNLHPNALGYAAMAQAVPLGLLRPSCG